MGYLVDPLCSYNPEPFVARIPGSKSYTNRALIVAAMRMGETGIKGALHSDDTDHLAAALNDFGGLSVEKTQDGYHVHRTEVALTAPARPIYIGGAGTPARLLLGFAVMAQGETTITGNRRLSERPMGDILRALDKMGVAYHCEAAPDLLPIKIAGGKPSVRAWRVSGAVSSQFTSSLLLLAAQQPEKAPVTIEVADRLVSRPYVNMTVQMLQNVGIDVDVKAPDHFVVTPGLIRSDAIHVEPDASAMSYFLGAAAISGTSVTVPGIGPLSAQGDVGFARLLERMGCALSFDADGLTLRSTGHLSGIDADMDEMPDTVLTLAAVAPFADSPTRIRNIGNLRLKECDRVHAAATELRRLGVHVEEGRDYLTVSPSRTIRPATIETYDDHRVAMAFSLIGLVHEGVVIADPACVTKSFPGYWEEFSRFHLHHAAHA